MHNFLMALSICKNYLDFQILFLDTAPPLWLFLNGNWYVESFLELKTIAGKNEALTSV